MNKNFDPDQVSRKYERNFIENVADMIENARNLEGVVSHETILEQLPNSIVEDARNEMKKIKKEMLEEQGLSKVDISKMMEEDYEEPPVLEP